MDDLYIPRKLELWELAILSRVPPARRAIERITSGILNLTWAIIPPRQLIDDPDAHKKARQLEQTLRDLNGSDGGIEGLIAAVVRDLLCYSVAAIKRLPGDKDRLFGASPVALTGIAEGDQPLPADTYLIYGFSNSDGNLLASPLEKAAGAVTGWLEIFERRRRVAGTGKPNILFGFDDISEAEIAAFRAYLELDEGTIKTIGGKTVTTLKLTPDSETEFLLRYEESLLRQIAISFSLTPREIGLTTTDRQETVGISARSSFTDAILPLARNIYRRIETELIGYYAPGYRLVLNESEPRTKAQRADRAVLLWDKGVIKLNEALVETGHDPIGPEGEYRKPTP